MVSNLLIHFKCKVKKIYEAYWVKYRNYIPKERNDKSNLPHSKHCGLKILLHKAHYDKEMPATSREHEQVQNS